MNTGSFDGVRFAHSARREAQRDAGHRASFCNDDDGPIWPTKGRVFIKRALDIVANIIFATRICVV